MNEILRVHIVFAGGSELSDTGSTSTVSPEEACSILQDYCRAKIDAKNIEAGQPLWKSAAHTAQERRP